MEYISLRCRDGIIRCYFEFQTTYMYNAYSGIKFKMFHSNLLKRKLIVMRKHGILGYHKLKRDSLLDLWVYSILCPPITIPPPRLILYHHIFKPLPPVINPIYYLPIPRNRHPKHILILLHILLLQPRKPHLQPNQPLHPHLQITNP
jgi:hypothetical protein